MTGKASVPRVGSKGRAGGSYTDAEEKKNRSSARVSPRDHDEIPLRIRRLQLSTWATCRSRARGTTQTQHSLHEKPSSSPQSFSESVEHACHGDPRAPTSVLRQARPDRGDRRRRARVGVRTERDLQVRKGRRGRGAGRVRRRRESHTRQVCHAPRPSSAIDHLRGRWRCSAQHGSLGGATYFLSGSRPPSSAGTAPTAVPRGPAPTRPGSQLRRPPRR